MNELRIADIKVTVLASKIPFNEYLKIFRMRKLNAWGKLELVDISQTLYRMPVIMRGDAFASEEYGKRYIEKHFDKIPKNVKYVVSFENVKFSSKIRYELKD